jgi:hypothetical protein
MADQLSFPPEVLTILDNLKLDPKATCGYELTTGGLWWSDERPATGPELRAVSGCAAYKYALAYRASLTLGQERAELRPAWRELERHAPSWPGLRPERRGEGVKAMLIEWMSIDP